MSARYPDRQLTNGRYPLGIFSEKIFLEKLARGERTFGQPLTMDTALDRCGAYERNTIIEGVKILHCESIQKFFFHKTFFNQEHQLMMDATPKIKLRNNVLMYASNPHHSDINQIKLYFDGHQVQRCLLKDLYCKSRDGILRLKAVILLIDKANILQDIDYSCIYDFPQTISHYKDIDPEAKQARLSLGESVPDDYTDPQLNEFFLNSMIGWDLTATYDIKILDFKNNTYYVDVIYKNQSIMSRILNEFKETNLKKFFEDESKRVGLDTVDNARLLPVRRMMPTKTRGKAFSNYRNNSDTRLNKNSHSKQIYRYPGALEYFRNQMRLADTNRGKSFIEKRFHRVLVTDWNDPQLLAIQPVGCEYIETHESFVRSLHALPCIKYAEESTYMSDKPYQIGEHVLFRNVFGEPALGKWLRGVVVALTCYNKHSVSLGCQGKTPDHYYATLVKLIEDGQLNVDDLQYLIRSVDYGYRRRSSHINMRHLKDLRDLKRIGTWTISCRLFGISPLLGERRFSSSCVDVMDSWMRERLLDNGRLAHFHILFRSDLNDPKAGTYDNLFEISLFHRYEPPYTIDEAYLPRQRKTRFECLNWHLVERGLAGDSCSNDVNVSSKIQLEEYIVNLLIPHQMI